MIHFHHFLLHQRLIMRLKRSIVAVIFLLWYDGLVRGYRSSLLKNSYLRRLPATKSTSVNYEEYAKQLLAEQSTEQSMDAARSVFCNVELNCANIEAVGFDMDFTLAQVTPLLFLSCRTLIQRFLSYSTITLLIFSPSKAQSSVL